MSIARAVLRTLRNLWAGLLHGHPAQCRTVWSAHGATYCWLCECTVTNDPVQGYALVGRGSGEIARGSRGGVPTRPGDRVRGGSVNQDQRAEQDLIDLVLCALRGRDLDASWGSVGLSLRDRFDYALLRLAEKGYDLREYKPDPDYTSSVRDDDDWRV